MHRNPFSSLPLELRQATLYEIPDIATLDAAIQADDSLNSALSNHLHPIVERILHNEINSDLFPEALAVLKSARLSPWSKEGVSNILDQYVAGRPSQMRWSLTDARAIHDIHQHIQFFANDYIASTLSVCPINNTKDVSPTERRRITRTFYRFEIFCNLFRGADRPQNKRITGNELQRMYFDRFPLWENEQLACVYDYLLQKIHPAYYDLAAHSVEWGARRVPMYDGYDLKIEPFKNYILSKGIAYLHRLVFAETFQERWKIVNHDISSDYWFLQAALTNYSYDHKTDVPLSEWGEQEIQSLKLGPKPADNDEGPFRAWRAAHHDKFPEDFVYYPGHRTPRSWGYVMWDYSRLQKWEWDDPSTLFDDDPTTYEIEVSDELDQEMEESWARRGKISRNGGSGWWSKDDESKIVWQPRSDKTTGNLSGPRALPMLEKIRMSRRR